MARIYNFNPGPSTLPETVLNQAREALLDYKGLGTGVMEISHRAAEFTELLAEMKAGMRRLFSLPDDMHILFCQGGARTQFAMVPMNFLHNTAAYINTGVWSDKAVDEANIFGKARDIASSKADKYSYIPEFPAGALTSDDDYLHITSNNTVMGTQFHQWPDVGDTPLVVDMSSDIGSRVVDFNQFDLVYAGAQKNFGPAGVTLAFVKQSFAEKAKFDHLPRMMRYQTFIDTDSLYNTPPTWNMYVVSLMVKWLESQGGVAAIEAQNKRKADMIYGLFNEFPDFYRGTVREDSRSLMNITFRLPTEDLEKQLVAEAKDAGFMGLKGHRIVGGIRVSNYNAVPEAGTAALAEYLRGFARQHG